MSGIEWRSLDLGSRDVSMPLAEVRADAAAVLGRLQTIGEGAFLRWDAGDRRVTLRPLGRGRTAISVEDAARAADRDHLDFDHLPDDHLPYLWRADDITALPNGTEIPGERIVDTFAAQMPALVRILADLIETAQALDPSTVDVQMHIWYADPAHDGLEKSERWKARRTTVVALLRKAGETALRVAPLGVKAPAERVAFRATADGAAEAAAFLSAQFAASGASRPDQLRNASMIHLDKRRLELHPLGLGIPSRGLWE